jgi:hypothetical protein
VSHDELAALVPPPAKPAETGAGLKWADVEKKLKTPLPADYKSFIEAYGTGKFANFYFVYNPFSEADSYNLRDNVKRLREDYKILRADEPENCPYPIYPSKAGILPWGNDENGNNYFWVTKGTPDEWLVVADNCRGLGFIEYDCSFSDFLGGVLKGEIKPLSSGEYPRPSDRVFTPYQPPLPPPLDQLSSAVQKKDRKRVEELLKEGVDPNGIDQYTSVIFSTAINTDTKIMKLFLDHGADPNLTKDGWIPLRHAINSRETTRVKMLLDAGAKIEHPQVLECIAANREPGWVKMLLEAGANPNLGSEREGETPLHLAVHSWDLETVKLLLEHGADVTLKDNKGITPIDAAEAMRPDRMVEILPLLRAAAGKK